jgi:hypothetical protein
VLNQGKIGDFMGFDLGDIQAFQKPSQLPVTDLDCNRFVCIWPPESLALQATIEQPESIIVPVQNLDLISQSIAKMQTGD